MAGLSQTVVDYKQTGSLSTDPPSALKDYVHYLSYFIFGSDGKFVRTIKQTDTSPSFGLISDNVPAGDYTVVFVASKYDLSFGATTTLSTARLFSTAIDDDIFFKKITLTVGSKDISQSLVLDRVVGYVEVALKETLPSNVAKVDFAIQNDYANLLFSTGSFTIAGVPSEKRLSKVLSTEEERTNITFGATVLNDTGNVIVQIICYNSAGTVIKEVKVQNVQCVKNKRTVLSGKVFASATGGFSVSLNTLWDSDPISVSF
ncbi:FimB/Mfa2 family fimbrial subunit [Arcticibacter sp. MXS-1]|uniref:FimB/Mfa2 family fimbrial subunit n=1 Tax=Arcticibacter sp. MXS-1 TaxID=3341726 RepID=UPI0035A85351